MFHPRVRDLFRRASTSCYKVGPFRQTQVRWRPQIREMKPKSGPMFGAASPEAHMILGRAGRQSESSSGTQGDQRACLLGAAQHLVGGRSPIADRGIIGRGVGLLSSMPGGTSRRPRRGSVAQAQVGIVGRRGGVRRTAGAQRQRRTTLSMGRGRHGRGRAGDAAQGVSLRRPGFERAATPDLGL